MKDLVSIIVPFYNARKYVEDCFQSIINQTYQNIEVIAIDDGSTDGGGEIVKKIAEAHSEKIFYYFQTNKGTSAARNSGIARAKGEYIIFVDADDMLYNNAVEIFLKIMKEQDTDCVGTFSEHFPDDVKYEPKFASQQFKIKNHTKKTKIIKMLVVGKICSSASNKMFKSSIIKKIEGYPKVFNENVSYSEDKDFNFKYFVQAEKYTYANIHLYRYRRSLNSAVRSPFKLSKLSNFIAVDEEYEYCKQNLPKLAKFMKGQCIGSRVWWLRKIIASDYKDEKIINSICEFVEKNIWKASFSFKWYYPYYLFYKFKAKKMLKNNGVKA